MDIIIITAAVLLSCALVIISIPAIVRVVKAKNLFDVPDQRKVHKKVVPTMGGIAIFIGISISTLLLSTGYPILNERIIFASMILLLFIGIKDDIMLISPLSKFSIQLLAAIALVVIGDFRITNLHGVMGITEVHYYISIGISILMVIAFINAYNLIDGVDGLAAGLGILGSAFFGIWFYLNGFTFLAILSASLVGSLIGFLRYNMFGKQYKIFMGDTGSLIIGLLMVVQVIEFVEFNTNPNLPFFIDGSPSVALAFVIIPITDTMRVFALRLFKGISPFFPDRNHVHHCLLRIYNRHYKVTLALLALNMIIIGITLMLCVRLGDCYSFFFVILGLGVLASILPSAYIYYRKKKYGKYWFRLKHYIF